MLGVSVPESIDSFLKDERPFMELGRRGSHDEVANVIAFLGSDAGSFVNGSNCRADAGSAATISPHRSKTQAAATHTRGWPGTHKE